MWNKVILSSFLLHIISTSEIPNPSEFTNIKSPWESPSLSELFSLYPEMSESHDEPQQSRIINGNCAKLGQFPFSVLLISKNEKNETMICGGSLIKMDWVLTAGHCLQGITNGYVFAGLVDADNGTIAFKGKFTQSQIFIHPEYFFNQYLDNDIAMIKLSPKVLCHKHINIIDLPCRCDDIASIEGLPVTTVGFGRTKGTDSISALRMDYINLDIVDLCVCKKKYSVPIFDNVICASSDTGKNTCIGDSGSALIAEIGGRKVIVGISSFTDVKCATGRPAVFTRVSYYLDWINDVINSN